MTSDEIREWLGIPNDEYPILMYEIVIGKMADIVKAQDERIRDLEWLIVNVECHSASDAATSI